MLVDEAGRAERLEQRFVELRGLDRLRQLHRELRRASCLLEARERRRKHERERIPEPADLTGERHTVHLGHLHVEDGDVVILAAAQAQERLGRRFVRLGVHAPRRGLPREDLAIRRVVVDDQHALAFELRLAEARIGGLRGCLGRFGADRQVERGSDTRLALHFDRSAHQLDEALRDRQAEPGAAVAAGRRGIDLAERLEEPVHPVLRDPDAGVSNRELGRPGLRRAER